MLATIAVEGYRSLRSLVLPLDRLTVVTGANGTGKSSLYRALRLLAECALGGAVGAVAREGGLRSTLWAGPEQGGARAVRDGVPVQGTRRTAPVALRLGFAGAAPDDLGYAVDLGLPQHPGSAFGLDPEIKVETIWSGPAPRPATLQVERRGPAVRVRDDAGGWAPSPARLRSFDSVLTELVDPVGAPEVVAVRETLRSWRFYDQLRTDAGAPARAPQVGTRTPVLAHDGADLAAALETVRDLGRGDELDAAVSRAFPGSRLAVHADDGRFEIALHQDGLLRPLTGAELSDGTLRYLFLVAALLSPRPPELPRAQRARDEPAPRPAARARRARARRGPGDAGRRGDPRGAARRGAAGRDGVGHGRPAGPRRPPRGRARPVAVRRDDCRGPRGSARPAALDVAPAVTPRAGASGSAPGLGAAVSAARRRGGS